MIIMILIFSSFIASAVLLISATPEIISFEIDSILQKLNNSRQCERAFIFGNAAVFYNTQKKEIQLQALEIHLMEIISLPRR